MSAPGSLRQSVSPDGPQVVIGIAPPSIAPEEHDEGMIAESRGAAENPADAIEPPVEPPVQTTLEQRSVERDGLVAVHHVSAMQRQVGFTMDDTASSLADTFDVAAPEPSEAPAPEVVTFEAPAPEAVTAPPPEVEARFDADDDVPTPPPIEAAARVPSSDPPEAPRGKILDPDEISIPPIGDLHEDKFFSDGEHVVHAIVEDDWDLSKVKSQRKAAPEVVERRHRFTRWVRWAVAGAAVVCLAATIRTVATKPVSASASKASAAAVTQPLVKAEAPKAEAPKAEEAPKVEAPKAEAVTPPSQEAQTEAPTTKAEEPKAEKADEPKAAPTDDDIKTAVTQKRAAQQSLERGKLDDAIASSEKAVELNPTDGEAWLILGASYQQKGKLPEARKAFKACTEQGKKGPIGECRAMLRM